MYYPQPSRGPPGHPSIQTKDGLAHHCAMDISIHHQPPPWWASAPCQHPTHPCHPPRCDGYQSKWKNTLISMTPSCSWPDIVRTTHAADHDNRPANIVQHCHFVFAPLFPPPAQISKYCSTTSSSRLLPFAPRPKYRCTSLDPNIVKLGITFSKYCLCSPPQGSSPLSQQNAIHMSRQKAIWSETNRFSALLNLSRPNWFWWHP